MNGTDIGELGRTRSWALLAALGLALATALPCGAASLTPGDIPGLYAWYTADSLAGQADGSAVSHWDNAQGNAAFDLAALSLWNPAYTAPTYTATGLDGGPGVLFQRAGGDASYTPMGTTENFGLIGNPGFTLIFVGQIAPLNDYLHPVAWGNGGGHRTASVIEIQDGRLDWATGWGHDALTANGSFSSHFDNTVALSLTHQAGGTIAGGTSFQINGVDEPVVGGDTSTPNIVATPLYLGPALYGASSPDMLMREVIIYDRALSDSELASLGPHLQGSPVPVPSSLLLLGSGLAGLVGFARRKRE